MKIQVTRKQVADLALLLVICATWFFIGWTVKSRQQGSEITLVEQVRQKLLSEHPGELPTTRELTYAAIRGMLRRVGDPHAALLEPSVSQRFRDDFTGQSGVIGLFPEAQNGEMVVSVVFPGEPADRAGLKPGDVILSVDGVEFNEDTTSAEAILLIRGPVDTPARFVVRRGEQILEFDPVRQERTVIEARMLDAEIAYLAQYTFTTNATRLVKEALQDLLSQHPQGLIWDLRSNGGGSMQTAQEILSFFVEDGLLFIAELKGDQQKMFMVEGDAIAAEIPLVVLIGERTYSAAETSAVAIQERKRGTLIGGTTFGKGTIQATEPLVEGCMLQMTIAKWLSPTGQWFEGRGVTPDFLVSDDINTEEDEVLRFAVDHIRLNTAGWR